jgi:dTDP-4-amino-4,6-dideoxygalactose transaminase
MPVAVYGVPVPTDEWDKFMDDTGIPVIIDAAAALDVQQALKKGLVAYSLHATKPFSIGEGGVLVGRRRDWIEEARSISNFGTQMRVALRDGSNAKLSEYHGAVAQAQLDRWVDIKKRRRDVYVRYRATIEKTKLDLQFQNGIDRAVVSALMLRSSGPTATNIVNGLNGRGIAAHRMYLPPLYHHPHFAGLTVVDGSGRFLSGTASPEQKAALMINSEALHASVFGVPFHSFLGDGDMAHVAQMLAEVAGHPEAKPAAR